MLGPRSSAMEGRAAGYTHWLATGSRRDAGASVRTKVTAGSSRRAEIPRSPGGGNNVLRAAGLTQVQSDSSPGDTAVTVSGTPLTGHAIRLAVSARFRGRARNGGSLSVK
jgi:hypothetical protein